MFQRGLSQPEDVWAARPGVRAFKLASMEVRLEAEREITRKQGGQT